MNLINEQLFVLVARYLLLIQFKESGHLLTVFRMPLVDVLLRGFGNVWKAHGLAAGVQQLVVPWNGQIPLAVKVSQGNPRTARQSREGTVFENGQYRSVAKKVGRTNIHIFGKSQFDKTLAFR